MNRKKGVALKPIDVDYARDIFTELVVAWTTKASAPPNTPETEALARKALEMAEVFTSAQEQTVIPRRYAIGQQQTEVARATAVGLGLTFAELAKEWGGRIVRMSTDENRRNLLHRFERYVFPHLANRPVADVEPREILIVVRGVKEAGHPPLAYQIFQEIRHMYRYALAAGLSKQDPTSGLTKVVSPPIRKWSSALFDPEWVGGLLLAIRQYRGKVRSTARFMYRLLPMLFLRPSELRKLEWKDVDLHSATIVIPALRMKNRRPHVVPLARQAVRVLREVHAMTGGRCYVFNNGRGLDEPPGPKCLHNMLYAIGYRKVMKPSGFRTMAATWLHEQGGLPQAVGRQLSHVTSDRNGRVYDRAEYLPDRRKMMQAWADHLEGLEYKAKRRSLLYNGADPKKPIGERHHAAVRH